MIILRVAQHQPTMKAAAVARLPGYQLVMLASLHQSTMYCAIKLLSGDGNGVGDALIAVIGMLISVGLPAGVVAASVLVPRRFVEYELKAGSRFAQKPWAYLVPTGTVLPRRTRLMLSSLVTSFVFANPALGLVSFSSSFFANLVSLLPADSSSWLCSVAMILSATAHFALALTIAVSGMYRFPTSRLLNAGGLALIGVYQVQILANWQKGIEETLTVQAALSIARSLVAVGVAVMEQQMSTDPTVALSKARWQVGDGGAMDNLQAPCDANIEMMSSRMLIEGDDRAGGAVGPRDDEVNLVERDTADNVASGKDAKDVASESDDDDL